MQLFSNLRELNNQGLVLTSLWMRRILFLFPKTSCNLYFHLLVLFVSLFLQIIVVIFDSCVFF